jgi:hypothetical protein
MLEAGPALETAVDTELLPDVPAPPVLPVAKPLVAGPPFPFGNGCPIKRIEWLAVSQQRPDVGICACAAPSAPASTPAAARIMTSAIFVMRHPFGFASPLKRDDR